MKSFRHPEIAQLKHELTLAPARHRLGHIAGIAQAILLIDPKRAYPYSFVCFHVTGYRPRRGDEQAVLGGKRLIEDLVHLADVLTAANPLPTAALLGRCYNAEALAARFNISTRTIKRWQKRGMLGCWSITDGEPARFVFTSGNIQRFVAQHTDAVRRGGAFKLMSHAERAQLIARARELAAAGTRTLHAVTVLLSEETGRAVETVRLTLRKYDQENPQEALFDRTEQAREVAEAEVIFQAHIDGESIAQLARRFGKTEKQTRETLVGFRAGEIAATPVEYIYNASFDAPGAEAEIVQGPAWGDLKEAASDDVTLSRVPGDLPAYLQALYRTPLLGPVEEQMQFMRMNFLLHGAEVMRQRIAADPSAATASDVAAFDEQMDKATQVKNHIVQANLRLVVSIAKRHMPGRLAKGLFEWVSDGNIALMRAVEKFDYGRGFRFSTYGSWAIMRAFAKSVPGEVRRAERFRTGHDEIIASTEDCRAAEPAIDTADDEIRSTVADGLAALDQRERTIIERHFGLGGAEQTSTLDEISREIGLSKERVRQIERSALAKLRGAIGDGGLDLLAG